MGSNLAKVATSYASPKKDDTLDISVYYKNDGRSVVSTIKIPKEVDLKSFLLLNQQENSQVFLNEIDNKSFPAINYLPDSTFTSIDNLSEFDSLDDSTEIFDEITTNMNDADDDDAYVTSGIFLSNRQRTHSLNSNENYVIIVQNVDVESKLSAKRRDSKEIVLNNDILLNVTSFKNECTNILSRFF